MNDEPDFDRIEIETRKARRERFRLKHPDKAKTSYNIGIIGLGNVGTSIAGEIAALDKHKRTNCNIKGITLIKATHEEPNKSDPLVIPKTEALEKKILTLETPYSIPIKKLYLDELTPDIANSLDVCFVSYRAGKYQESRDIQTQQNIPVLKDKIIPLFGRDYEGTIVVVTNLTDTLADAFAQYSDVDSRRIIGMNHLDVRRFVSTFLYSKISNGTIIGPMLDGEVNAYVWGCHDNPQLCFDKINVRGVDISHTFSEEEKDFLSKASRTRGESQVKSGAYTSEPTARACIDTLIAIMDQEKIVTASTLHKCKDGSHIYIGLPVRFEDGYAKRIQEDWLEGIIESNDFVEVVDDLKEKVKKAGLGKLIPKLYKKKQIKSAAQKLSLEGRLFVENNKGDVHIYDLADSITKPEKIIHVGNVLGLEVSKDSLFAVKSSTIEEYDKSSGKLKKTYKGAEQILTSCSLLENMIYASCQGKEKGAIFSWNTFDPNNPKKEFESTSPIGDVIALNIKGKKNIFATVGNKIYRWVNSFDSKPIIYNSDSEKGLSKLKIIPEKELIMAKVNKGKIYAWSFNNLNQEEEFDTDIGDFAVDLTQPSLKIYTPLERRLRVHDNGPSSPKKVKGSFQKPKYLAIGENYLYISSGSNFHIIDTKTDQEVHIPVHLKDSKNINSIYLEK